MTSPEEEAYLTEETKKNLDLLHTPGSRIQSKGSGKERLVLGQMEGIFLLTVCTEPDGSQSINPIRLATINKVARVIAEGRDYTLTPQAQTEKSAPKEVSVNDFQVGGWIISASGSLRRIISIEGDAVTTLKRDGDTFIHESFSLQYRLLNTDTNQWIYAVLPPSDNTSLLERHISKQHTTILGDTQENRLRKTLELFQTPYGVTVTAGCDVGYQVHERRNTPNQDRVVIDPKRERFAVIDGVGGSKEGDKAAQLLAESFTDPESSIDTSVKNAREQLTEKIKSEEIPESSAAAFVSAEIIRENGKIFIEEQHLGDCSLLIFDEQGKYVTHSKEDSLSSLLVDEDAITEKQAQRHPRRNVVLRNFSTEKKDLKDPVRTEVKPGYRVLLMSDGIANNLNRAKIEELIAGKTQEEAFMILSRITTERMKNQPTVSKEEPKDDQNYSDGFYPEPKQDNRGLVVFDVV